MKRSKLFLLGMLALALTFGLALSGCPTEDDENYSWLPAPAGYLTITGIPDASHGNYVNVGGTVDSISLMGFKGDHTDNLFEIDDQELRIPLYLVDSSPPIAVYTAYNGNHNNIVLGVNLFKDRLYSSSSRLEHRTITVSFINGNASIAWPFGNS
jgi:hypothetical protein